jgi:hypothetical protein
MWPLWRGRLARGAQCPLTDTNSCLGEGRVRPAQRSGLYVDGTKDPRGEWTLLVGWRRKRHLGGNHETSRP